MNLDAWFCTRDDIARFAKMSSDIGIQYLGLCCGNCAHYTRTLAETLGRTTPSSKYSPDMSQHFIFSRTGKFLDCNSQLRDFIAGKEVGHPEGKA